MINAPNISEDIMVNEQSLISMNIHLLEIEKQTLQLQLKNQFLINRWYKEIYLENIEQIPNKGINSLKFCQTLDKSKILVKIQDKSFANQLVKDLIDTSHITKHKQNGEVKEEHHIQSYEQSVSRNKARRLRAKNDTKNIPKNYGKAIINFIQKNPKIVNQLVKIYGLNVDSYMEALNMKKKYVSTILGLRSIWIDEEFEYAKVTRILSMVFLKKYSLRYIFRSRVANFQGHIKYRNRIMDKLRQPKQFTRIKIY